MALGQSTSVAFIARLFRVAVVAELVHCQVRPFFQLAEFDQLTAVTFEPFCVVAHEFMALFAVIGRVASIAHCWLFGGVAEVEFEPLLVVGRWSSVLVAGLAEEGFVTIAATCWVFSDFKLVVGKPVLFKVRWWLLGFNRWDRWHLRVWTDADDVSDQRFHFLRWQIVRWHNGVGVESARVSQNRFNLLRVSLPAQTQIWTDRSTTAVDAVTCVTTEFNEQFLTALCQRGKFFGMRQCLHALDVQSDDGKKDDQGRRDCWQSAEGMAFRVSLNERNDEQKDDEKCWQNERTDKLKMRREKFQQLVKPEDIKVGMGLVGGVKGIGSRLKWCGELG